MTNDEWESIVKEAIDTCRMRKRIKIQVRCPGERDQMRQAVIEQLETKKPG